MEKTQTILTKSANWYNPFYLDDKGTVSNIIFYKDGEILATTKWFEHRSRNNIYNIIYMPFGTKRATKINLNRKDAFCVRSEYGVHSYDLYIHADLVSLKSYGREVYKEEWDYTYSREEFSAKIGEGEMRQSKETPGEWFEGIAIPFYSNVQTEATPEYKRCEKLAAEISECAMSRITASDAHNLLRFFNISRKRTAKTA